MLKTLCRILILLSVVSSILFFSGCASTGSHSFVFAQLNDTQPGMTAPENGGYKSDIARFKQAVKQINEINPDFTVMCGDLVEKPTEEAYKTFIDIKAGFQKPCYCVPGNHDVGNNPTAKDLDFYRKRIGKDYYAVDIKGCKLIFINAQIIRADKSEEYNTQKNWLIKMLEEGNKNKERILVFGHIPLYIQEQNEKDEYFNFPSDRRKEYLELFDKYGVLAYITGHTHKYVENKYKNLLMISSETTSVNFDKHPYGFRLWEITPENITHKYIPLTENKN